MINKQPAWSAEGQPSAKQRRLTRSGSGSAEAQLDSWILYFLQFLTVCGLRDELNIVAQAYSRMQNFSRTLWV